MASQFITESYSNRPLHSEIVRETRSGRIVAIALTHRYNNRHDFLTYFAMQDLWRGIEDQAKTHSLIVADMPSLVKAMNQYPIICDLIKSGRVSTLTTEYIGYRDNRLSYEVSHHVGPLSTWLDFKEVVFNRVAAMDQSIRISNRDWESLGKGYYRGSPIIRIHIDDLKKSKVPATNTPYLSFTPLTDMLTTGFSAPSSYDDIMRSDRMLMLTGSPSNQASLARLLFPQKAERKNTLCERLAGNSQEDSQWDCIFNPPSGRFIQLSNQANGLEGRTYRLSHVLTRRESVGLINRHEWDTYVRDGLFDPLRFVALSPSILQPIPTESPARPPLSGESPLGEQVAASSLESSLL